MKLVVGFTFVVAIIIVWMLMTQLAAILTHTAICYAGC